MDHVTKANGAVNRRQKLLLLGGGGHCISVIEALVTSGGAANSGGYDDIVILDCQDKVGQEVLGVPIVGTDEDIPRLRETYDCAFVALGSVGDWGGRERLFGIAEENGFQFPAIIHPKACVSNYAKLSPGVFVGMGCMVNAGSLVGEMCILNSGSIIEHECHIGRFSHIAPGTILCADVRVGEGSHIGAGSVIRQGLRIGGGSIIGAGSIVTRDIPDNVVAYGNPCRVVWKKTRRL